MTGIFELSEALEAKVSGVFRISEEISRSVLSSCLACNRLF